MTGIEIMPHGFFNIQGSVINIEKVIEVFVRLASSAVNHADHLPPVWRGLVILLSSNK